MQSVRAGCRRGLRLLTHATQALYVGVLSGGLGAVAFIH